MNEWLIIAHLRENGPKVSQYNSTTNSPCRVDETNSQHAPGQEWTCPPADWKLLFRGSRDGFGGRSFHSLCDDQGSTILIAKVGMKWKVIHINPVLHVLLPSPIALFICP